MNTLPLPRRTQQGTALVGFLIMAAIIGFAIASVSRYVSQSNKITARRDNWNAAYHYAEAGVAVAISDINQAFTNTGTGTFKQKLRTGTSRQKVASTNGFNLLLSYTNATTFTNQPVLVQLLMPNVDTPPTIVVTATANVNGVVQTSSAYLEMGFGLAGAIISDSPGTSSTSISKSVAQDGNVVITGPPSSGQTAIDGGILANGRVNWVTNDVDITLASSTVSMTNYSTANQIPDYTLEGSSDQLFDFKRFIVAASNTPATYYQGGVLTNVATIPGWRTNLTLTDGSLNYFTNVASFAAANNWASTNTALGNALEGVVVVNISQAELKTDLTTNMFPRGINIRGTLLFNFASNVTGLDKIINTSDVYINKADLSGLNATNPATFTTGYPPTYTQTNRNPRNSSIGSALTTAGKQPFVEEDDLPAMMYSVGIFDLHGSVNICGACYTPSFMEIENKQSGQIQYIKGAIIVGQGVIVDESSNSATNVVSYDPGAVSMLATSGTKGKALKVLRRY